MPTAESSLCHLFKRHYRELKFLRLVQSLGCAFCTIHRPYWVGSAHSITEGMIFGLP